MVTRNLAGFDSKRSLTSGQPLLLSNIDTPRFSLEIVGRLVKAGARSACFSATDEPNGVIGTLNIYRRREADFSQGEVDLLNRLENQVALAMGNALAFRHIAELKDKLAKEKLYLEHELRTEAAAITAQHFRVLGR